MEAFPRFPAILIFFSGSFVSCTAFFGLGGGGGGGGGGGLGSGHSSLCGE